MSGKLQFDLVSPERLLLSEAVDMVVVPGTEGDFGVLAGHAPVMATVRPGVLVVEAAGREAMRIFIRGGFAEVTAAGLTVLAEEAEPLADLDAGALDQHIRDAEEDVADAGGDEARRRASEALDHLRDLRAAL